MSDAELRSLFDAARDADYEELAREARALLDEEEVSQSDVARLRRQLADIVAIDFFGAHGQQGAEAAIAEAEQRCHRHPDVSGLDIAVPVPVALTGHVWVTRRHIHVDRMASAWFIRRFIDPAASFKFVDGKSYSADANELRFDMAGAEFTHEEDRCTFETLLRRTGNETEGPLQAIAEIVHDLDIADGKYQRPESAGIAALIAGICAATDDDDERLARGGSAFDGLYANFAKVRRS